MTKLLFQPFYSIQKIFKKIVLKLTLLFDGEMMYSEKIREIYLKEHGIKIGYGSYGGCFNHYNIPRGVTFGNYCSIAQNVKIYRANHPKDTFTSHPLLYNPIAGYVSEDKLSRPALYIGHDVWIGEAVIILPSVLNIGNGAIIGAGSIVTKDVLPYAIVAGNPAKVIGHRFNNDAIDKLEKSQWWHLKKEELIPQIERLNKIISASVE